MGLFFNNQDIANAGVTEKAVLYSRSRFSCEPSEIGAAKPDGARVLREAPAAFRRLCVETHSPSAQSGQKLVPAAFRRLCVETLEGKEAVVTAIPAAFRRLCVETACNSPKNNAYAHPQPPSGGCVLKPLRKDIKQSMNNQPPSGGCVLKPENRTI